MSAEKQGETYAEYLTRRGWIFVEGMATCDGPADLWFDGVMITDGEGGVAEDTAITIQSARDEQEERAAWSSFAAGALASPAPRSGPALATWADDMLVEYKARFARRIAP